MSSDWHTSVNQIIILVIRSTTTKNNDGKSQNKDYTARRAINCTKVGKKEHERHTTYR